MYRSSRHRLSVALAVCSFVSTSVTTAQDGDTAKASSTQSADNLETLSKELVAAEAEVTQIELKVRAAEPLFEYAEAMKQAKEAEFEVDREIGEKAGEWFGHRIKADEKNGQLETARAYQMSMQATYVKMLDDEKSEELLHRVFVAGRGDLARMYLEFNRERLVRNNIDAKDIELVWGQYKQDLLHSSEVLDSSRKAFSSHTGFPESLWVGMDVNGTIEAWRLVCGEFIRANTPPELKAARQRVNQLRYRISVLVEEHPK